MNTERISGWVDDVDRRAAVHAALGEPARLRIADSLSLGDLSPADLQAELGMPSNLLAHHLNSLEDAGLITRHRSEADRRRSYLRLERAALAGILPTGMLAVPRIVFVCTANTARSHLADALWRQVSDIPSTSAGTHPAARIARGTLATAERHGITLDDIPPRDLLSTVRDGDLIVTVCDRAHEEIHNTEGLHWSIPDPVPAGTRVAFDHAFDQLSERIHDLAPHITAA